jgi:PKD domain
MISWARGDHSLRLRRSAASTCRLLGALIACTGALFGPAGVATAQVPEPATPITIDGPSSDISGLSAMSVARDGSGGIVYLKQVLGVAHVFVSRLVGGVFGPPEQVDAGLIGDSSQPVIAAGNGGLLLIAFVNAGQLYVVNRPSAASAYAGPSLLAAAAGNPSIGLSSYGKGYLAFTADGSGGHDVRCAYYNAGSWAVEPTALDADPASDAGTGGGRPRVAVASDGIAIVVWGEQGHVFSRRVWGTSPSVVYEQADVPSLSGLTEVTADNPQVAAGGDSSYADVVFHETFAAGIQQQSRELMRRLRGSQFEPVTQPDGVAVGGASGADDARVAMGEFGAGLITAEHTDSNQLFATLLGSNGVSIGTGRFDSLTNASAPHAVPAMVGASADLVAWQEEPQGGGPPEVRARFSTDGLTFGPELVVSSPASGPVNASDGLGAAGDYSGNAVLAWVQGSGDSTKIVADQLYQPPGSFGASIKFRYVRSARPVLSWSQSRDHWGPVRYALSIDGAMVTQTTRTSLLVPGLLGEGPHSWLVTASNPAGLSVSSKPARVWIDTLPPTVQFTISGVRRVGRTVHLSLAASDVPPPPTPPNSASGIASVLVKFGDGTGYRIRRATYRHDHVYTRARLYTVTIVVQDRAGNKTTATRTIKIAPKPKPKKKKKKKGHGPHHSRRLR